MTRLLPLALLLGFLGFGLPSGRPARAGDEFVFHHENVMGTSLELRVRADSPAAASSAESRALGEIDRLSAVFSGYDPSSEFSRWARSKSDVPVRVSADLFAVLDAADRWRERSGGAFDPRAEAFTRLWSAAAAAGREPSGAEVDAARARAARPAWALDAAGRTAIRLSDGPVSLDAIAKGYIVGKAAAAANRAGGIHAILLNVGGDLRAEGDEQFVAVVAPWADSESSVPLTSLAVRDRSVSTSGSSQRGYRVGGRWFSHVIDPRAGRPASRVAAATVVAADPAGADALATALNVLPPAEGLALARSAGAECLLVTADGRVERSGGFARYEKTQAAPADPPAQAADPDPDPAAPATLPRMPLELVVNFEINRPDAEGGRYRRPYVAVWVEDRNGFPVRNLVLWVSLGGSGPFQWVPDLKRWYQSDQARKRVDKTEMVLTMARPTRPPGKYSVIWDGKDDRGKPVAPGEYTVCIDAAREHGTYQGLRKTVTLADAPFSDELPGNVEIKAASIEYREKGRGK